MRDVGPEEDAAPMRSSPKDELPPEPAPASAQSTRRRMVEIEELTHDGRLAVAMGSR